MGAAEKVEDLGRLCLDWAYEYAQQVSDGAIPACQYTKLAVKRWYRDLETGGARGLSFDENAAARVFRFFGHCRHYQGEWAGRPIVLSPWQCFIVANVFGWKRADGTRRFRTVYEEIPRKNGKTTKLGGIGLYMLTSDGEPGAQVYSAATKRDQARELFDASVAMRQQSPIIRNLVREFTGKLNFQRSKYVPLSADSKTSDGFNVHAGLVDELHAHPNSGMWDVLDSGTASRAQPLMWAITTAGFDRNSFCYEQRDYAIKVLEQSVEDDSFFAIIYTLDKGDDPGDPKVWAKANPNLNISVKPDKLEEQWRKASAMPSFMTEFLTKRLNVWTYGETKWMNMEAWNKGLTEFDSLAPWTEDSDCELDGETCWGGLDLASVEDMASFRLTFRIGDKFRFIGRSYLPEAALERRLSKGDKTLEPMKASGHLVVTPGAVIDYARIRKDIDLACERFDVAEIAFDRWNSSQIVNELIEDGVEMVAFGQGYGSMSTPMKEMMRLTLQGKIEHNDPVLTWAMSNVVADTNPAADIKPAKNKVKEKIDTAVAQIMSLGRAIADVDFDSDDIGIETL